MCRARFGVLNDLYLELLNEGIDDVKFMGINGFNYINDSFNCMICDDLENCSNCDDINIIPWTQDLDDGQNCLDQNQELCEPNDENGDVWDIWNVTDIELSRSCTTAVESWLLNLPTIELRLSENEWYQSKDFAAGSFSCSKPQEYFDLIDSLLEGKNIDNDLKILLESIYDSLLFDKLWINQTNLDDTPNLKYYYMIDATYTELYNKFSIYDCYDNKSIKC